MADDLAFFMALRVQGIASCERVADAVGQTPSAAEDQLRTLASDALAEERTGRIAGFTLTAEGSGRLDELLEAEGLRDSVELKEAYDRFLQLNERLLKICSDWQIRRIGGAEQPNDHSDAAYDGAVIDRLDEMHERARVFLKKIAACAARFAPYAPRLDACVERLVTGDARAFTAPLAESYHTVWFELHQDFLLTLGLEREA